MTININKKKSNLVKNVLNKYTRTGFVVPKNFLETSPYVFDFTKKNKELSLIDLNDSKRFIDYVDKALKNNGHIFGAGQYNENRIIYRRGNLFRNKNLKPRSVHLGIDLWLPEGAPIYSPLPAIVHSFKNNNNLGDYGPTIILEHVLSGVKFYTLYGHLSKSSLQNLRVGMKIKNGEQIATIGNYNENGCWPTHLHFQIISNLLRKKGDFPGVASLAEREYYLAICPDPNLILRIDALKK